MRPSAETISELLGSLYEAAASPEHWPHFFTALREQLPSDRAFFLFADPAHHVNISMSFGLEESWQQAYYQHFWQHDVLFERFVAARKSHGEWIGTTQSVIADGQYFRTVLYNEFARPQGQFRHCGAALGGLDGGVEGGLSINRTMKEGPFLPDEIALLAMLAPHMRRALNLHRTLSNGRAQEAELRHTVDALDLALISLGTKGHVLRTTLAASAILQARDGLWLDHQHLRAGVPKENGRLSQLIAGASTTGAGHGERCAVRRTTVTAPEAGTAPLWTPSAGGAMLISRRPPKRPLQLIVTPFYSSEILLAEHPAALIFISDPDAQPVSRAAILRALYSLSPAECRMADLLAQGFTVTAIADQMKTTVGTARFRLKEIFRKTNTARQAQLVQLIGALPGIRTIKVR